MTDDRSGSPPGADERYRAFIETSSEAIWLFEIDPPLDVRLDPDAQIEAVFASSYLAECNDALARQYGYESASEMIGLPLRDFLIPEDPANRDYLRAFIAAGYRLTDAESVELDRSGSRRWFLNNLVGILGDGKLFRAWGTQRDVTASRQAAHRTQLLDRISSTLATSLDPERTLDVLASLCSESIGDWCVIDLLRGDMIERVAVATSRAELADLVPLVQRLRRPEPRATSVLDRLLAMGAPLIGDEVPPELARKLDGIPGVAQMVERLAIRSWMAVPLVARGCALGAITFMSSAERFDEGHLDVAAEIGRRAGYALDNARLFRAATDANRAKDEFLATLSHELRTPLTATVGWAAMLRMGLDDPAQVRLAAEAIEQSSRAQAKLIDDILDVSRIASGKLQLVREPVDPAAAAGLAVETIRPAALAKNLSLSVELEQLSHTMLGDADRVLQIVWNLLSNAVKFTPMNGAIMVEARQERQDCVITVRDTGVGISADFLPHVFERFRQGDSTSTRSHGGLGLGLSIVKTLAELQGGSVEADSPGEGLGSRFTLRFPLTGPPPQGTPDDEDDTEIRLDGSRVLLVDDQEATRVMLWTVLVRSGAEVEASSGAEEALTLFATGGFDVVVTDLAMPGVDGFTLATRIREQSAVPILAVTAYRQDEMLARAIAAGCTATLVKPVGPATLLRCIRRLVDESGDRPAPG